MLTLALLRHAKSSWDSPSLNDHERPLAKRGAKAASAMGAFMARRGPKPDLVLCSDAVRTRATLALVMPELGPPPVPVEFESALYLAGATDLLERIRKVEPTVRCLLVVGHNPGLHALALGLTADGVRKYVAALATKFPTTALAVLNFPVERWAEIAPATGRLTLFMSPKQLP